MEELNITFSSRDVKSLQNKWSSLNQACYRLCTKFNGFYLQVLVSTLLIWFHFC
jgi:hypothetical protein